LEKGRGEASDKIIYKTMGEDAGRYDTYKISSDICGIKEGEGREIEGYCGSNVKREEH
jgi:hypothetical protein